VRFEDPRPDLLAKPTCLAPERGGLHVRLDPVGVLSTQRLALSGYRGGMIVAIWPAELKEQAEYLYGQRLASRMIQCARNLF